MDFGSGVMLTFQKRTENKQLTMHMHQRTIGQKAK